MHKLPPLCLYRLDILAATGPRFYRTAAYMRRLEALGLIVPTGRTDTEKRPEYRITDTGRAELVERYGPSLERGRINPPKVKR